MAWKGVIWISPASQDWFIWCDLILILIANARTECVYVHLLVIAWNWGFQSKQLLRSTVEIVATQTQTHTLHFDTDLYFCWHHAYF